MLRTISTDLYCGGMFSAARIIVFASLDFGTWIQFLSLSYHYSLKPLQVQKEKLAGNKFHGTKMYQIAFVLHAVAWYMQIHPHAVWKRSNLHFWTFLDNPLALHLCLHFLRDLSNGICTGIEAFRGRCGKTASFARPYCFIRLSALLINTHCCVNCWQCTPCYQRLTWKTGTDSVQRT